MATNVPVPVFGDKGFVSPTEADILAGVQADQQAAFGGNLNPDLTTPQGQLAQSQAAIIGNVNNQFVNLANGVDPAYASGRMQDAIGRIYYIERNAAKPTVVTARCIGLAGTIIPIGASAQDQNGQIYTCSDGGTIPVSGFIDLTFACIFNGPIACPIGFLNTIYRAIPGWDSILNSVAGVEGNDVESRADFEYRRQLSVAVNAQGSLPSVLGAVLQIPGVLDAYAIENPTSSATGAVFTASISTTTLTVSAMTFGAIAIGQTVTGAGVQQGTIIESLGSGTGGNGTYMINISQTVGSEAMASAVGGVSLVPHSLYVAAYGGNSQAIGQAIWTKKSLGCDYNGNTTVTVQDTQSGYVPPYPTYSVKFQRPTPMAVKFQISMQNNLSVPSDAITQIQNAIVSAFVGSDGGSRARIGSWIFASRFYSSISKLGSWASIYSILLGVGTADKTAILMQIDQIPTVQTSDISVAFV